ncbi:MAG: hypothetical protein PHR77_16630 [Kiritimatiellae bacterium]|nr:hypothetical protein [Kiritimatiellia bacterium]MDD5521607.1 hypothetical protein [Kiritimatiellia bacterium]
MKDIIAETKVKMTSPKGESKFVVIEIGRPYSIANDEAACPISMHGLYPKIKDLHGVDTLQALALAFEFIRITIQKWEEKGYIFEFQNGATLPANIWFEDRKK